MKSQKKPSKKAATQLIDTQIEERLFAEIIQQHGPQDGSSPYIVAIDEVGRGSLFGPVTVAGVLVNAGEWAAIKDLEWFGGVGDSKGLKEERRREVARLVEGRFDTALSHISVGFIETYNINKAIQYGVYRVTRQLGRQATTLGGRLAGVWVDGNYRFEYPQLNMRGDMPPMRSIVKGDSRCFTIAAASNVAKVRRDDLIARAAARFPHYGLESNAGYGTASHREAIRSHGATKFHRKSFLRKI